MHAAAVTPKLLDAGVACDDSSFRRHGGPDDDTAAPAHAEENPSFLCSRLHRVSDDGGPDRRRRFSDDGGPDRRRRSSDDGGQDAAAAWRDAEAHEKLDKLETQVSRHGSVV